MTDDEILEQNRFSLLVLELDEFPSENVLTKIEDPLGYKGLQIWYDAEGFAVSRTKLCQETNLAYELYETYQELVEAVKRHFSKQVTTETFVVYNTKKALFLYFAPADDERDEDTREWGELGEATFGPHLRMTQIKDEMVSRDDHVVLPATITVNIPV